ncbi:hypothetical protein DFH09DRAFT_250479 [Mycena vulgaris]|nr:hypothetical protein DFH09DRAFT_250479 [Mycena vulgaris]
MLIILTLFMIRHGSYGRDSLELITKVSQDLCNTYWCFNGISQNPQWRLCRVYFGALGHLGHLSASADPRRLFMTSFRQSLHGVQVNISRSFRP